MISVQTKAKVIFLGDSGVGKTSIILREDERPFDSKIQPTLGATFLVRTRQIASDYVQLQIWDTAGQERFRSMVPMYLRNAKAAFIVYDVTNKTSFDHVEEWVSDIFRWTTDSLDLILLGNKCDLSHSRVVSKEEGEELARRLNITSALENSGIDGAFNYAAEQILLKKFRSNRSFRMNPETAVVRVTNSEKKKKKCCIK